MPLNNEPEEGEISDVTSLANDLIAEWQLSSFTNIQPLMETSVILVDALLESKYPSVYIDQLIGTTPQEILFCILRKLFSVNLLFKNNPNILNDYTRSKNVTSISNPDAGSVSYASGEGRPFSIVNLRSEICSILKNLGLSTASTKDPNVKITVNSLV